MSANRKKQQAEQIIESEMDIYDTSSEGKNAEKMLENDKEKKSILLFDSGEDVSAEIDRAMHSRKLAKKRVVKFSIPGVALILVVVLAFTLIPGVTGSGEGADDIPSYRETRVTRGNLTVGISEAGTVSIGTQNASSEFTAKVMEIYVKAGQEVKAGDAIALLSTDDIETQIASLESAYNEAVLNYNQALIQQSSAGVQAQNEYNTTQAKGTSASAEYNNTVARLQNAIDSANTSYNAALDSIASTEARIAELDSYIAAGYSYESELTGQTTEANAGQPEGENGMGGTSAAAEQTLAEKRSAASTQLIELNNSLPSLTLAISEAELAYSTGLVEAQAKYDEAINAYNNSSTVYSNSVSQAQLIVDNAKLAMDNALSALEEAQESMGDGRVTAPCDGLVQSVNATAGDSVQAGMAIATITDASKAYVSLSITQDDIADITLGKQVNISFSAYEGVYTGEVDSISTTAAREGASTVSYTVSIAVDGDTTSLYTGMTGDVTFITKQVQNVLYVSNNAIYTENGQSYVKVLDSAGNTVETPVTTGFSDGQNVEISSGLLEGDTAIIEMQVGAA